MQIIKEAKKIYEHMKMWISTHKFISWMITLLVGAVLGWFANFILPAKSVEANNLPQKELSCVLNYSEQLMQGESFDNRLQISFDGNPVDNPCLYNISIINSGDIVVNNEDFKSNFVLEFKECGKVLSAQVSKPIKGHIVDEVLSNASIDNEKVIISGFLLNPGEEFTISVLTNKAPSSINYDYRIAGISNIVIRNALEEQQETIKGQRNTFSRIMIIAMIVIILGFIIFLLIERASYKRFMKDLYSKYRTANSPKEKEEDI